MEDSKLKNIFTTPESSEQILSCKIILTKESVSLTSDTSFINWSMMESILLFLFPNNHNI